MFIEKPNPIDLSRFAPASTDADVLYGLPKQVVFCRRCVYSNQKPNSEAEYKHTSATKKPTVNFDKEGICQACRTIEAKQHIDWSIREAQLRDLCDRHRSSDGSYDCVVPGSGGKDSVFAAHILKYKYGMHPLTVTFAPHLYTDWGWSNYNAWINSGFDNYLFSPNRRVQRLLTRLALENLFHPFQPFMMGQMYFPPKMALLKDIKLVFYGENPSDYGNAVTEESPIKELRYFTYDGDQDDMHIGGVSQRDLKASFGLNKGDLDVYMPPQKAALMSSGIEVHYLGYYLRWHPQSCFYYAAENAGFKPSPERTVGTYSKYSSIDDKVDDFHYYTTFLKFGIGRATYDSAQEVRSADITREEAVALVSRYDGEFPERFADEVFRYLSIPAGEYPVASSMFEEPTMDLEYFEHLANRFRSPHLWMWNEGAWHLRYQVFAD
jgi:N-acetyl sugar amidotransferase